VERELKETVESKVAFVPAVYYHTLEAGGKRLRPALTVLSGHASGRVNARTYHAAIAVELVHIASLIHDDVIDDAGTRRGRLTANRIWGNKVSILVADYLFSSAYTLLSRHADAKTLYSLSRAIDVMCEGELTQLESEGSLEVSEAQYHEMIADKTGALMAIACELGARLSGAADAHAEALYRFGLNIGTAFQMADDLLDLAGEEEKIGKPVGNDIRNGRLTLPLIHTLRVLNGTGREELISLLGQGDLRPDDFLKVRRLVHEAGGIDYAQRAALNLVAQGKRELEGLPPSEARATLSRLADYVTQRRR
jgi:geranylgeranyl pyrophosphate synthase